MLGHPIAERCEQVVLALFQKAQEQAMDNFHTPIFVLMEQATVKAF